MNICPATGSELTRNTCQLDTCEMYASCGLAETSIVMVHTSRPPDVLDEKAGTSTLQVEHETAGEPVESGTYMPSPGMQVEQQPDRNWYVRDILRWAMERAAVLLFCVVTT